MIVSENTIHSELFDLVIKECFKIDELTKKKGVLKKNKYTTFWLDKDTEPDTLIEYIVKDISYQDFPNGFPENYAGMEWWSQIRDTKENITFHYDKDEAKCSNHNIYIFPMKSTVTYLSDIGGPTVIFKDEIYDKGYLSFPKKNKHLKFDGHLFHGVIGPLGDQPNKNDKRITLLINYWSYKPDGPNCEIITEKEKEKVNILKVSEKHKSLQTSNNKIKSKIIKMNYKNGFKEWIIYKMNKPYILNFAKTLKKGYTYSFQFIRTCITF